MSTFRGWASRPWLVISSVTCLSVWAVLFLLQMTLYHSHQQQQVDSTAYKTLSTLSRIKRMVRESASAQVTDKRNLFVDIALPPRSGAGIFFDKKSNLLYVTRSLHHRIIVVDPDEGDIVKDIYVGGFPDDLTVAPDGTLFWTDFVRGTVYKRSPSLDGEPTIQRLYRKFTYPLTNGIILSDDGGRLLFSQCFNPFGNAILERNLKEDTTTAIDQGVPFCASNGMDFRRNALYATRTFESRVIKINLASSSKDKDNDDVSPTVSDVTKAIRFPHQVKFDSKGTLWGIDFPNQIVQIDYKTDDVYNNVKLYAKAPGILDSLAFDKYDRLYVAGDNTLWEVETKDRFRFVTKI